MTFVMAESKPDTVRLSVNISPDAYERLTVLRAALRRQRGKAVSNQELCEGWITDGLAQAEAELAKSEYPQGGSPADRLNDG